MKHIIALLFVCLFAIPAFADDQPAVTLRQALEAAEKSMNERGLGKDLYIDSVVLNRSAMFGGETYWFVKWSHPIPVPDEPGKREVGIKVRMDGSATRLVKSLIK